MEDKLALAVSVYPELYTSDRNYHDGQKSKFVNRTLNVAGECSTKTTRLTIRVKVLTCPEDGEILCATSRVITVF